MAKSKKLNNNLITAALYILVGILFILFRAEALNWLLTIVGVLFIVDGVLNLLQNNITSGAISLAIGLLVILGGWLFVEIILIIFGVLLLVKGIAALLEALSGKKDLMTLIAACGTIVVGILLIISRWALVDLLFIVMGIVLIADGVLSVIDKK